MYRILVINPGSTSTKMAVFEDNAPVLEATLRHSAEDLEEWGSIPSQKPYRKALIEQALEKCGLPLNIRGEAMTLQQFAELSDILKAVS